MILHEHEPMALTITRKQLQAYGLSKYHAQAITKTLNPIAKRGGASLYILSEVITSIHIYLERPQIRKSTREEMTRLFNALQERLGNLVQVPFGETSDLNSRKLITKLLKAMADTDASLANLKADAVEIEAKYEVVQ